MELERYYSEAWVLRLDGSLLKNDNLFILHPLPFLILVQEITNKYCAVS